MTGNRLQAQLPSSHYKSEQIESVKWPMLHHEGKSVYTRIDVKYSKAIKDALKLTAGISDIEQIQPHVLGYVSRSNHAFASVGFTYQPKSKGRDNRVGVQSLSIFEKETGRYVSQAFILSGSFNPGPRRKLFVGLEIRSDQVDKAVSLSDFATLPPGGYTFQRISYAYRVSEASGSSRYIEGILGNYYGVGQFVSRVGKSFQILKPFSVTTDIEFNLLSQDHVRGDVMPRLMFSWQPSRNISTSVLALYNSYLALSGILASITYGTGVHKIKIEYRELRDNNLNYVETQDAFFSSRILFQYSCRLQS